jgi:hypothetical protein
VHQLTGWSKDLRVSTDGDGVVSMVGAAALRMLADRTGLTQMMSEILARPGFRPVHDRGRVLTDIACTIAAGGVDLVDIEALRAQGEVFGPVASDTTALRALEQISDRDLHRIDAARAAARAHLWSRLPHGVPASTYAGIVSCTDTIVLRLDGTLTIAHSAKENAEGTYKKSFGFHSLGCWIDNTSELAVLLPRPGSAGANTVADLIGALTTREESGVTCMRWVPSQMGSLGLRQAKSSQTGRHFIIQDLRCAQSVVKTPRLGELDDTGGIC